MALETEDTEKRFQGATVGINIQGKIDGAGTLRLQVKPIRGPLDLEQLIEIITTIVREEDDPNVNRWIISIDREPPSLNGTNKSKP